MTEPISDADLARVRAILAKGKDLTFWEAVDVVPGLLARLDRAEAALTPPRVAGHSTREGA